MDNVQAAFFEACRMGDINSIEQLYERDNSIINTIDAKGYSPLIIAVYNNQSSVVDFLLQKGASTAQQDGAGNTALMGVCFRGYKELAEKLLEAGAAVNQRNYNGATALTFAATFGHLEIAEMLLKKGADLSLADVRGKSPLDHAIIQENEPMINLLEQYLQR